MKKRNFTVTLLIDQTPEKVFQAINNVRGWWPGEIKGSADKLNDEFTYRSGEFHMSTQKIVEFIPDKKVVWLVTESKLNFVKDKNEWTGTKISFEISEKDDKTQLCFTHIGLVPEIECFRDCSNAWSQIVQQNLLNLIKTVRNYPIGKEDIAKT
jgi:hypothetical protein